MCMWFFVPAHLRIAFLCSVSLIWQVFLSTRSYCNEEDGCTLEDVTPIDEVSASYAHEEFCVPRKRAVPIMREGDRCSQ